MLPKIQEIQQISEGGADVITSDAIITEINGQDTTHHFFALLSRFILTLKKDTPEESNLKLHSHLFFILFTLNQADQGMLTLGDLARELDISKQQLTKLVNDLEARGLAARMRGEENHRTYYLQITEDGRQTLSGMVGSLMEPAERTFSSYTGDEKQELLRSILCLEQFLEDIRTGLANT